MINPNTTIQTPIIKVIGNLVTGNNEQTQKILSTGILHHLKNLLKNNNKNIRKEVCWTISNITAGSNEQISYRT